MDNKNKVLTDKQTEFLFHLANDAKGDIRLAMDLAGYSKGANIHDVVRALSDEIVEITKQFMAAHGLKAMNKLVGVLDNPNQLGAANLINASKEVLDRAGIHKKNESDITVKLDGVIILPAKGSVKSIESIPYIDISPSTDPVSIPVEPVLIEEESD